MSFPLTDFQVECLGTIHGLVADKPWLPPSYVMAHVRIESGWKPTIKAADYDTTGSVGLMQVSAPTVADMVRDGLIGTASYDQTVPENSLAAGIAYLGWCRGFLMQAWGFRKSILYHPVCEAYNEGPGNVLKGILDNRYFLKWAYAQQCYAFVDLPMMMPTTARIVMQPPLTIRPRRALKLAA